MNIFDVTIDSDSVVASHGGLQATAETRTHDRRNNRLLGLFDLEQEVLAALRQRGRFFGGLAPEVRY